MKPRRLHKATILSIVTVSCAVCGGPLISVADGNRASRPLSRDKETALDISAQICLYTHCLLSTGWSANRLWWGQSHSSTGDRTWARGKGRRASLPNLSRAA